MGEEKLGNVSEWKERVWIVRASDGRMSAEPATLSKLRRGLELGKLTDDMSIAREGHDNWENIRAVLERVARRVARPVTTANDSQELPTLSVQPASVVVERTPGPPSVSSAQIIPAPASATARPAASFHGGFFDFSFTTYVTTGLVKILYAFHLCFVALWLFAWILMGVSAIVGSSGRALDASSMFTGTAGGIAAIFVGASSGAVLLIFGRVFLECIVVAFRISETLSEINTKTR